MGQSQQKDVQINAIDPRVANNFGTKYDWLNSYNAKVGFGLAISFVIVIIVLAILAATGVFSSSSSSSNPGGENLREQKQQENQQQITAADKPVAPISEFAAPKDPPLETDAVHATPSFNALIQSKLLSITSAWYNESAQTLHVLLHLKTGSFLVDDRVRIHLYGRIENRRLATSMPFTFDAIGDTEIIMPYPRTAVNETTVVAIHEIPFLSAVLASQETNDMMTTTTTTDKNVQKSESKATVLSHPLNPGLAHSTTFRSKRLSWEFLPGKAL